MADKKWYEKLYELAPAAATALLNPTAGAAMAIKVIAEKLGVSEKEEEIESAINRMDDTELKLKLKGLDLELYKASRDERLAMVLAEERIQHDAYEFAKIEAVSNDEYVRRTRPMIARWSFYSGAAYSIFAEFIQVFVLVSDSIGIDDLISKEMSNDIITKFISANNGAEPLIAAALFSPCMAYIGVRTFDKSKSFNK